jgi:hypothetical protein
VKIFTPSWSIKFSGIFYKWKTNTEYITKKGAKSLYFMKILKSYNAPKEALKTFYVVVVRSVLEYGAQVWNGGLTKEQSEDRLSESRKER